VICDHSAPDHPVRAAKTAVAEAAMAAERKRKGPLRRGFSTGTAATAAAVAALRFGITGVCPQVVAVRLPGNLYLGVRIKDCRWAGPWGQASVIKDGGDDPDVTHRAELIATVSWRVASSSPGGLRLAAGEGVGVVTKPGLPVAIGEPAINPAPRAMLRQNLAEEWQRLGPVACAKTGGEAVPANAPRSSVWLPFEGSHNSLRRLLLEVEIQVPKGTELARHTLNPRLGIVGGISILGTTGIVKPFSHEAYEETIDAGLKVAAANGCLNVVLSTGGKSERFARSLLGGWREESFVQVADFFAFAVRAAAAKGFSTIVHSAFFGKVVKMAQGHAYTHAHRSAMDLQPLAELARQCGHGEALADALAAANTARQALELLQSHGARDVIEAVVHQALEQSLRLAGGSLGVRLLLFDYDGQLLVDATSDA
jgi:cobalt-precorrin-5B (C1)-methyltransferase